METKDMYLQRLKMFSNKKDKFTDKSNFLSMSRLVTFLGGGLTAILAYKQIGIMYCIGILFAASILFLYLVIMHQKVIDEAKRYGNLAEINKKCICRMDGSWTDFSYNGESYKDPEHSYSNDLDIFGRASLFQWINTTNTYYGNKTLKRLLEKPDKKLEQIKRRQGAVKELNNKIDFCQNLECIGLDSEDISKDPQGLLEYSEDNRKVFKNQWIEWVFYILPTINILSIIICWLDDSVFKLIPMGLMLVHLLINLLGYNKVMPVINSVRHYKNEIKAYQKLIKFIEDEEFTDEFLLELKSRFYNKNISASFQIKGLEKIVDAVDMRYSPALEFLLNVLVFWNFHCVFSLERWKSISGKSIRAWIETIGMFEALSSLALISQMNPDWVFADFCDKKVFFEADKMGHPLINNDKRVCNSFKIDNKICIITGSNMSGKTTFLRTIGINLVLSYAGAAVCAKKLETSIMDIYTSMRVADDLNAGISTFYAELIRIKTIIDISKKKEPMIFLIDEVFRGTNSEDRIIGAKNVLVNLDKYWIIGLISTHDFELCSLGKDRNSRISNYHFEETYLNNEIKFDFLIKPGRCTTTNAKYLMKMVGIELVI